MCDYEIYKKLNLQNLYSISLILESNCFDNPEIFYENIIKTLMYKKFKNTIINNDLLNYLNTKC